MKYLLWTKIIMKHCKVCGKRFKPKHGGHKYCSKECRDSTTSSYSHQYYLTHKEEKAAYYKKRWESKDYKRSARKSRLKRKYGITPADYNKILEQQNGLCAICDKKETKHDRYGNIKNLQVDHNHVSGKVRGLLCFMCNAGIGMFDDNPKNLQSAIKYLSRMELNLC